MLREIAPKYKGKLPVNIMFDNQLAHQIEAGADIFLMPSKSVIMMPLFPISIFIYLFNLEYTKEKEIGKDKAYYKTNCS
jgi:hypothetical protein